MKHQRFRPSTTQQQGLSQLHKEGATEFANVEELLRHDALHTPVPPRVADRLASSVSGLQPRRPKSWWRRWFGRSG